MAFFKKHGSSTPFSDKAHRALITASNLFDAAWYLKKYPDVGHSKMDPALHYLHHGGNEGRNPGPNFDTLFYLSTYPDIATSDMNALVHYLLHGEQEGREHRRPSTKTAIQAMSLPGLFSGSKFDELSIGDPLAVAQYIARSVTPAELLPRVDPERYSPLISIVMPIYNTPPRFFREVLQSIFSQTYTNWQLCMVDDGSTSPQALAIFEEMARSADPRIKTIKLAENTGIAGASDAALTLATGEFVGFVDHDDLLTPTALSEVVGCLRDDAATDFIYTDHVMVDHDGNPQHFAHKPIWSPEFLLSTNYIVHFKVVRRSMLLSVGGLKNEIDNAQDLGVSCALAAAGAKIRYLPKPLYLWREHRDSVAFSTDAKPGIEGRLMEVYDRHLGQLGINAKQTWPTTFKVSQTGVFQVEFMGELPSVALILLSHGSDLDEASIRERFAPVLKPSIEFHIITLGAAKPGVAGTAIENDAAMLELIKSLDSEIVVFATTTGKYLGIDWLTRLSGYAAMNPAIGAAGGKVLDPWLQIRSGGMLVDAAGEYRTIAGGHYDNERAHWFIGQIASNVDAVSSQLMATRRSTLIEMGGIDFHTFGDAAGVAYCAKLASSGYRIVYDPHSRHCDVGRLAAPASAFAGIRELGRKAASRRVYRTLGS